MVGRSLADRYPARAMPRSARCCSRCSDWTVHHPIHADRKMVDDVSFNVRRGEVVGIAGLMGAGPHRTRHEHVRPLLRRADLRRGASSTARRSTHPPCARAIDCGPLPTPPRTARPTASSSTTRSGATSRSPISPGISRSGVVDEHRELAGRRATTASACDIKSTDPSSRRRQPVRRQPAEGRAVEMAVRRAGSADPGRADARHRRRRQIRDLHASSTNWPPAARASSSSPRRCPNCSASATGST